MPHQRANNTGNQRPALRLAIADDSVLIREGLHRMFSLAPQIRVVCTCVDAPSLLAAVEAEAPDAVLTDMRMPPTHTDEGLRIAQQLRVSHPRIGVIVLSQYIVTEYAAELLSQGATGRGYLLKDRIHDLDQLVEAVHAVAMGECRIDAQLVASLLARRRQREALDALTPRQREILSDIAAGHSNAGIAVLRGLTQRAVEKHVSEIFSRLGLPDDETASRRVHAVLLYLAACGP